MSLLLKASSAGAAKLALDVSAPGVLLKSYPIAVRRISARARKRWARAAQLPEAGRSLGLVAVDGAHQLVRQLGVVRGLARRVQAGLAAAGGALLEALHRLLGKAERLHHNILTSHTGQQRLRGNSVTCTSQFV